MSSPRHGPCWIERARRAVRCFRPRACASAGCTSPCGGLSGAPAVRVKLVKSPEDMLPAVPMRQRAMIDGFTRARARPGN
jgi:hypothetical protein